MASALPARAKALRERLIRIQQMGDDVDEAGRLDALRAELAKPVDALKAQLEQRALLVACGLSVEWPETLSPPRQRAEALLEKFEQDKKASTLTKGRTWSVLLKDAEAASTLVEAAVSAAWRDYQGEVFTGEAPATLKGRLAMTETNAAAFADYERAYGEFRLACGSVPTDPTGVQRLSQLAERLKVVAKRFDFAVPKDVKVFLEAVQSGGAPLALLTDDVKLWLKQNQAADNYRIRAAR